MIADTEISGQEIYTAVIPNIYQYNHMIEMVACGLLFRQTASLKTKGIKICSY